MAVIKINLPSQVNDPTGLDNLETVETISGSSTHSDVPSALAVKNYVDSAELNDITSLSGLTSDTTHRTVTDTQINNWNGVVALNLTTQNVSDVNAFTTAGGFTLTSLNIAGVEAFGLIGGFDLTSVDINNIIGLRV